MSRLINGSYIWMTVAVVGMVGSTFLGSAQACPGKKVAVQDTGCAGQPAVADAEPNVCAPLTVAADTEVRKARPVPVAAMDLCRTENDAVTELLFEETCLADPFEGMGVSQVLVASNP